MLGIIGGTSLLFLDAGKPELLKDTETSYGKAEIFAGERYALALRHGSKHTTPPHRINFRALLAALKQTGVDRVVGMSSVGSMREDVPPRSIVVPADFIQLTNFQSIYEEKVGHVVPSLDEELGRDVIDAVRDGGFDVVVGGVYFQTRGPRLETVAEVRMFSQFADYCGMTMATEATLAREMGLAYASVCIVDNYANGVAPEPLTYEQIMDNVRSNSETAGKVVEAIVEKLSR
jgi:5'-methylthioadenosine phosphorylase